MFVRQTDPPVRTCLDRLEGATQTVSRPMLLQALAKSATSQNL